MLRTILAASFVAAIIALSGSVTADPIVISNSDPGFASQGDAYGTPKWTDIHQGPAYIAWMFTGLTTGNYDVFVTWHLKVNWWESRNTASPFSVYDGGMTVRGWPDFDIIPDLGTNLLGNVNVNQDVDAAGLDYNGKSWFPLGSFSITGDKLSVLLTNVSDTEGTIIGDSVLIVPSGIPEPASLTLLAAGGLLLLRRRSV